MSNATEVTIYLPVYDLSATIYIAIHSRPWHISKEVFERNFTFLI